MRETRVRGETERNGRDSDTGERETDRDCQGVRESVRERKRDREKESE